MRKQKKDALTLACKEIISIQHELPMDFVCPVECGIEACQQNKLKCINSLKQYFQEQADIPDGWDVVKGILEQLTWLDKVNLIEKDKKKQTIMKLNKVYNLIDWIKLQLEEAGIKEEQDD